MTSTRPPVPAPPHRGGCLCGAVRYRFDAAPLATVACHCRDCQKLTGATNLLTIYADSASFHHEQGEIASYRKRGKELLFGMYGEVEVTGDVRVGDPVEPL